VAAALGIRIAGTSSAPSTGATPATTNTAVKPNRSTAATPTASSTSWGTPTARPYRPAARPCCARGTSSATSALPATVASPNPTPRTAESASTGTRSAERARNGAGAPSSTDPAASTQRWPTLTSNHGTASWVATVVAISIAVVAPEPSAPDPPRSAQSGTTGSSSAYPLKQSTVAPSMNRNGPPVMPAGVLVETTPRA
jgi:hypothetical protein